MMASIRVRHPDALFMDPAGCSPKLLATTGRFRGNVAGRELSARRRSKLASEHRNNSTQEIEQSGVGEHSHKYDHKDKPENCGGEDCQAATPD